MYINFKIDFGMVQVNTELTRYAPHQEPSLVDHVLTNRPSLISNIKTIPNIISNHCSIISHLSSSPITIEPQFRNQRDWRKCTIEDLTLGVWNSEILRTIHLESCPHLVASKISDELNKIIDGIAPSKG